MSLGLDLVMKTQNGETDLQIVNKELICAERSLFVVEGVLIGNTV